VRVDPADLKAMTTVDKEGWKAEIPLIKEHFETFGARLPQGLKDELAALEKSLS
jgi:phosphoenolpyruvate carboxykinase (GTP)